jgi:hypothetical protein
MKLILLALALCFNAVAAINVIAPTLETGALHKYFWMDYDKKVEAFKKTNLNSIMQKRGLDLLSRPKDEVLWSKFENGSAYYFFFTNIDSPITERFLIQRIKKTVKYFKDNKAEPYKIETSYLVEAFKTWTGYPVAEGTLKASDGHDGIFSNLGRNKTKVIYKEFETGVGTIEGLAMDTTVWPFDNGSLYYGTKYDREGEKLFDKVSFTDSQKWTLNVEVRKDSYLVESPELGLKATN